MINGQKVLGLITARGGSKGIKRKNLVDLNGKPLIAWTINQANKSHYIDDLVLSTDDQEIADVAKNIGLLQILERPKELAQDNSTSAQVLLHAIDQYPNYPLIVLLQPTSPLRLYSDIDSCIKLTVDNKVTTCVSFSIVDKHPHWMFYQDNNTGRLSRVSNNITASTNRQDLPRVLAPNGAVYVVVREWFKKHQTFIDNETLAYIMPKQRSIDIDNSMDLKYCEFLMKTIIT